MAADSPITADYVRSRLDYDPETGAFLWKLRPVRAALDARWNTRWAGKAAGSTKAAIGYCRINIEGRLYLAHRLSWLYVYGESPTEQIDHINNDRADNRIRNLRIATQTQNNANALLRCDNTSGFKGVNWRPDRRKWRAKLQVQGKQLHLGHYRSAEEAAIAYAAAARRYFGAYASV